MEELPAISVAQSWEELFNDSSPLSQPLHTYLKPRRWFGSKARSIRSVSVSDSFRMPGSSAAFFTLVRVEFAQGAGERYVVPLAFAPSPRPVPRPNAVVARISGGESGVLYDALADAGFCSTLLDMISRNQRFQGKTGEIRATAFAEFSARRGPGKLTASIGEAEQSNTSVIFGDRLILKVFRRVQEGTNPELEIGRFLTKRVHFPHTSPVVGAIEYGDPEAAEPITLAIVQGFVLNRGDAWKFTLEKMNEFAERVRADGGVDHGELPRQHLLDVSRLDLPATARDRIGDYLESARLLGRRTAELHLALSSSSEPAEFKPEPFSLEHQQSLVRTLLEVVGRNYAQLQKHIKDLPEAVRTESRRIMEHVDAIRDRLQPMQERPLSGLRCRCHGDYHLGQVLYTGQDFVIIDFEGEPARSLSERRVKQSPLRDVAGMLRSFDYAAHSVELPDTWHRFWYTWVSAAFLRAYAETAGHGKFLPSSNDEIKLLLDYHLLEKAIYELAYEINHRPDWVRIPLQGIMQLLAIET
jgi:trehalose synthase-fused probable maltokinase